MIQYPTNIEMEMKKFYSTLSEKDRRRYATVEAMKEVAQNQVVM